MLKKPTPEFIVPPHLQLTAAEKRKHIQNEKRQIQAALDAAGSALSVSGLKKYNRQRRAALSRRHVAPGDIALCRECGKTAPYTPEYFYPGHGHLCRACGKIKLRRLNAQAKLRREAKALLAGGWRPKKD